MTAVARTVWVGSGLLLLCVFAALAQQPVQGEGILERAPDLICGQATHTLWAVCGVFSYNILSSRVDLTPYECEYDSLQGPYVGIACSGIIDAQTISVRRLPCTIEVEQLVFDGEDGAALRWNRLPCAVSYDVIRGDPLAVTATTQAVDLGPVTCVQDDLPGGFVDPVPGPSDPEAPPPGGAFFYLVRAKGSPYGFTPYSISTDGLEGAPSSGDCFP